MKTDQDTDMVELTIEIPAPMHPHQVLDRIEPIEQRMRQLQYERMTDEQHVVTALEPAWVEQKHVPDEDGVPQPASETVTKDGIDMLMDESEYECSCGEDLSGWHEVQEHFRDVTADT